MFVKYTSRVNDMTFCHLVSFEMHNFWSVSQIHHSWNADKRLPVKFWTGLFQYYTNLATVKSSWTNACILCLLGGWGTQKQRKWLDITTFIN